MRDTVLFTSLHAGTAALLKENFAEKDVQLQEISSADLKKAGVLLNSVQVLLIGEEVDNPIRLAQDVYAQDKTLSIVLINDPDNFPRIKQALQFSPFIGPTVQSISNEGGKHILPVLEDALQRTTQRRSFTKIKSFSLQSQQAGSYTPEKVRSDFTTKVLQEAPLGAILISSNGTVFSINNFALHLVGKSEKDVLGVPFASLFPQELHHSIRHFILDGFLADPKKIFELISGPETLYLEMSVAPISLEAASNYKLVLLHDITAAVEARKRTEAHLKELEKLNTNLARVNADLDTFVYTASHDLKSPILNIEGLVSALEDELGETRLKVTTELEHIKRSVKRFKQTVEDLTTISRLQRSFEQKATEVDLAGVVEEVKQLLEREIRATDAHIKFTSVGTSVLRFHKRNLTSIVYNLVNNALKYRSPEVQPLIQISCWREEAFFCFSIEDNGLGIPSDKKERVFQLFKRMHSHIEGSGVGLYIVKRIIENNGGSVTIDTEEGKGSKFTVKLKDDRV